jgi:hypothetical protein
MKSHSDFWLTLHHLAHDLEKEGKDDYDRAKRLCEVLSTLPPAVQSVYLDNLEAVARGIVELRAQCPTRTVPGGRT